ncbi:hypothetical protein [Streptomyces sp. NPDC047928]|uniref:hypothetical protein n=1 Tax=unclassified Streptomyces TaxID=2593676 RepID=UPI00371BF5F8
MAKVTTRCRPGGRFGRLLLLAALLLGIVTMHAWGHASEHSATYTVAAPPPVAAEHGQTGHGQTGRGPTGHSPTGHGGVAARSPASVAANDAPLMAAAHSPVPVAAHSPVSQAAHGHGSEGSDGGGARHDGLDPAAVCLAVLGSLGFALGAGLLAWVRRRRAGSPSRVRAAGRALRALWPHPPPLRVALAELSVLRI